MFEIDDVEPGARVDNWTVYENTNGISGLVPAAGQSTDTIK